MAESCLRVWANETAGIKRARSSAIHALLQGWLTLPNPNRGHASDRSDARTLADLDNTAVCGSLETCLYYFAGALHDALPELFGLISQ
jgi:hypothetical protein